MGGAIEGGECRVVTSEDAVGDSGVGGDVGVGVGGGWCGGDFDAIGVGVFGVDGADFRVSVVGGVSVNVGEVTMPTG